jgi:dTDP-4-dehydrorhamnose reductase
MNDKISILVTGANSQLGRTLQESPHSNSFNFHFTDIQELDLEDKTAINRIFRNNKFDYCFNFAAYTDVNLAEMQRKKCFNINVKAVEGLSKVCQRYDTNLIHISTDYIFDGNKNTPYLETDEAFPINYYGQSKYLSEEIIKKYLWRYYIIRTSWLYSHYNRNFVKTISDLATKEKPLKIVADQVGTPTYAVDLIDFILQIVTQKKRRYGTYHFSNSGEASWFDFAQEIIKNTGIDKKVLPVDSKQYWTPAIRPKYSVLSKQKAIKTFNIQPRTWQKALAEYFEKQKTIKNVYY